MKITQKLSALGLSVLMGVVAVSAQATTTSTNTNAQITNTTQMSTPQDISVGTHGQVKLRGAISSISGPVISVSSWFGTFTVDTTNSKLIRRYGGTSSMSEFETGDNVTVWGTAAQSSLSISATRVQNMSIQKKGVKPSGVISNLNSSTNSFTLTTNASSPKVYQISLGSSTMISLSGHSGAANFSDLMNGMTARVTGVLERDESAITANHIEAKVSSFYSNGSISNINTSNGTFTFTTTNKGVVQVTIGSSTQLRINNGGAIIADLVNGMNAQVWGTYLTDSTMISANKVFVHTTNGVVPSNIIPSTSIISSTTISH